MFTIAVARGRERREPLPQAQRPSCRLNDIPAGIQARLERWKFARDLFEEFYCASSLARIAVPDQILLSPAIVWRTALFCTIGSNPWDGRRRVGDHRIDDYLNRRIFGFPHRQCMARWASFPAPITSLSWKEKSAEPASL
jgi:hypothetical protein